MAMIRRNGSNGVSGDGAGGDGDGQNKGFMRRFIGFAPNPVSKRSRELTPRTRDAQVTTSVCPF